MPIETKTEIVNTRIFQESHCKHCGQKIERTYYEQPGRDPRVGKWYHSKTKKREWKSHECDDTGVEVPDKIPDVNCENCNQPLRYRFDVDNDKWTHVSTGSWYCNTTGAEPD